MIKSIYKNLLIPERKTEKILIKPTWSKFFYEYKVSHWIKKSWYCYGIDLINKLGRLSLAQIWLNGSGLDNEIRFYVNKIDLDYPYTKNLYASYSDWGPFVSKNKYLGRGIYPGSKEEFESLIIQINNYINNLKSLTS